MGPEVEGSNPSPGIHCRGSLETGCARRAIGTNTQPEKGETELCGCLIESTCVRLTMSGSEARHSGKCFIRYGLDKQLKVEDIDVQNEVSASG